MRHWYDLVVALNGGYHLACGAELLTAALPLAVTPFRTGRRRIAAVHPWQEDELRR